MTFEAILWTEKGEEESMKYRGSIKREGGKRRRKEGRERRGEGEKRREGEGEK